MRILHTSDWHLGKTLEGFSRIEEQEEFIRDFIDIVNSNNIDLIIIAGDIYDNGNPPAAAERLFYNALKQLSSNGERAIVVISGNHDNPDRLMAASPIACEQGIIIIGTPKTVVDTGKCGKFEIVDSGEGYIELLLNGEKVVLITLAYPSEKRLNELLSEDMEQSERQRSYSERIGALFSSLEQKFRKDTVNIAVSHLFTIGSESTDSERPIELGGSLAVDVNHLPLNAHYIALGHLHKPQIISSRRNARYSGSPLQYSKSEIGWSKCCYVIDVTAVSESSIQEIYFKNYKPIEVWRCESIEDAIERCRENSERNVWVYLEIKTDQYISQENIKIIRELKKDIIEIKPLLKGQDNLEETFEVLNERSMYEMFKDFYTKERKTEPTEEVMNLFMSIVNEEEGEAIEACEA